MPEVNNVSPVLPIASATPVQGSANNAAVSQGNDGQPSFSQVLRDKQAAASASAKASDNSGANAKSNGLDSAKAPSQDADSKTSSTDGKTDAAQKDTATDAAANAEVIAKTPVEMAQLLATAGLMANVQTAAGTSTADKPVDSLPVDTAATTAATPNVMAVLPKPDKTAATDAAAAASLAAGTATSTSTVEQTLASQSQAAQVDAKGNQPGTSGGDQQAADRQPLLAVANQGDAEKASATTNDTDSSFSAALERASQNGGTPLTSAANQTQSTAPVPTHTVTTPVGRQGWADEVGQRVLWTAKSDSSRADLILTPPQLGRIEVSIHMNGDQANASFMAANPVAREALQDAMPKLRELMSQAGIQLGQADVSAGQSGQAGTQGERRQNGGGGGTGMLGNDSLIGGTSSGWTQQGNGLVDTFA